jgi:kynurenine formamidase
MKFIDLSHTISSGMPVFPDDLPVKLKRDKEINKDGYTNFQLCTEMHIGTHVDGPMHLTSDNHFISEIPLDRFAGKGVIFDVQGIDRISLDHIDTEKIIPDIIVLFHSGMDKKFGEKDYFYNHPVLEEDLINFLVKQKVKLIGIDWFSPDYEPYPFHKILLENNILILENLTNLNTLIGKDFEIFAFPLKIKADSSIVRAVAGILESV